MKRVGDGGHRTTTAQEVDTHYRTQRLNTNATGNRDGHDRHYYKGEGRHDHRQTNNREHTHTRQTIAAGTRHQTKSPWAARAGVARRCLRSSPSSASAAPDVALGDLLHARTRVLRGTRRRRIATIRGPRQRGIGAIRMWRRGRCGVVGGVGSRSRS